MSDDVSDAHHTASEEPAIDAVFWDIGGVILDADSVRAAHRAFVADLVSEHRTSHDVESALETWRTTVGKYFRERDGTEFRPAREAYRLAVEKILDESVGVERWRPAFRAVLGEHARPNPGAVEAIERLADAPVHLGVISDVDEAEGKRLLETFGVLEHFDSVTTSEEVGRTKPDPAMFETALEKAGVEPDRAAMIGDRYDHDVAGSADLGMTAIGYGADDGPATDRQIDDLRDLPSTLGLEN